MQTQQVVKAAGDVTAYSTTIAALVGWLPHIAALFAAIWWAIKVTEKVTGRAFHHTLRDACVRVRGMVRYALDRLRG